jgi:AcrR family transcriptional regulator
MAKNDLRVARAEQRRQENREIILHAAETAILRRGVGSVSMDDVAAEAQFSKATVYRYFRSKAELVSEIVFHFLEDLEARLKAVRGRPLSSEEKLREALAVMLRFEVEKENITRIFLLERNFVQIMQAFVGDQGRTGPDAVRRFIQKIKAKRMALVEDSVRDIRAGIESGEFRGVDPVRTARIMSALVQGFFVEIFWTEEKTDFETEADWLCDLILHGIARPRPASI